MCINVVGIIWFIGMLVQRSSSYQSIDFHKLFTQMLLLLQLLQRNSYTKQLVHFSSLNTLFVCLFYLFFSFNKNLRQTYSPNYHSMLR